MRLSGGARRERIWALARLAVATEARFMGVCKSAFVGVRRFYAHSPHSLCIRPPARLIFPPLNFKIFKIRSHFIRSIYAEF